MTRYFLLTLFTVLTFFQITAQINIFGTTSLGGEFDQGIIYKINGNGNNFTSVHHFNLSEGSKPQGSMMLASNGNLFGMTLGGGSFNEGVLFEFNPDTSGYNVRVNFDDSNTGSNPFGTLMQASNGKIYGTTTFGGVHDGGVLFSYDTETSGFETLWHLDSLNTGINPRGYLIQAADGKLYGMAQKGGEKNSGTIFFYDIDNDTCEKVFDFDTINGLMPFGSLTEASDGLLYGMTTYGGTHFGGVIFKFDPETRNFTKVYDLTGGSGITPFGSLLEVEEGLFYGLTFRGGNNDNGVLFSYDYMNGIYTKKIDFIDSLFGKKPYSSLMLASNGKLYGTTMEGGEDGKGTVFEYDRDNEIFTVKYNFSGFSDGSNPLDRVVEIIGTSGTAEVSEKNEYSLYPNPTKGAITVETGQNYQNIRVIIFDAGGRLVQQIANFTQPEIQLNLKGSNGIYYIAVYGKEGGSVFKVLKE